ncbi:HNH endonuclease [Ketogulonicigenium vulgare]|nr:HNH endonuclease signature motif containing protein [Ketogulonicigenium vulgare]ANW34249.1 hypothetical protein KvSKV_10355 [Ketogulonicigenium vulgare]
MIKALKVCMITSRLSRFRRTDGHRRLYDLKAWKMLRRQIFVRDMWTCQWPGCGVMLAQPKRDEPLPPNAATAHHKRDHKGDIDLFLDPDNLMAVCKQCHDRSIQEATHRGFIAGHDEDGRPIDPAHPWARSGALGAS